MPLMQQVWAGSERSQVPSRHRRQGPLCPRRPLRQSLHRFNVHVAISFSLTNGAHGNESAQLCSLDMYTACALVGQASCLPAARGHGDSNKSVRSQRSLLITHGPRECGQRVRRDSRTTLRHRHSTWYHRDGHDFAPDVEDPISAAIFALPATRRIYGVLPRTSIEPSCGTCSERERVVTSSHPWKL